MTPVGCSLIRVAVEAAIAVRVVILALIAGIGLTSRRRRLRLMPGHPGPLAARPRHALAPDRQAFDIERVRPVRLENAPVDHDSRGPAAFADAERRDDDVGAPAILLEG